MEGVNTRLSSQSTEFYNMEIHKRSPRYKCLDSGDNVEKYPKNIRNFCTQYFVFIAYVVKAGQR
jgi:hypothetical protein